MTSRARSWTRRSTSCSVPRPCAGVLCIDLLPQCRGGRAPRSAASLALTMPGQPRQRLQNQRVKDQRSKTGPSHCTDWARPMSSESVQSVRIRLTTPVRLLHGFILLLSGISGKMTLSLDTTTIIAMLVVSFLSLCHATYHLFDKPSKMP